MIFVAELVAAGVPAQVFAGMTRRVWQVSARAKMHHSSRCALVPSRKISVRWFSSTLEVAELRDERACTCLLYASDEPLLAALADLADHGAQLAQAAAALLADPLGPDALTYLGVLHQSGLLQLRDRLTLAAAGSLQALTKAQDMALTGWLAEVAAQREAALAAADCRDLDTSVADAAADLRPTLGRVAHGFTDRGRLALLEGTAPAGRGMLDRAEEAFDRALRAGHGTAAAVRAAVSAVADDSPSAWSQLPQVAVPAGGNLAKVALAAWRAETATLLTELAQTSARTYDWLATQRELVLALSAADDTDLARRAAGLIQGYPVLAEYGEWQARALPHVLGAAAQQTGLMMVLLPLPAGEQPLTPEVTQVPPGPVATYLDAALALVEQVDEDDLVQAAAGVAGVSVAELADLTVLLPPSGLAG